MSGTPRNAIEEHVLGDTGMPRVLAHTRHILTERSAFSPVPHLFITVLSVTLNLLIIHRKSVVLLAVFFVCRGLHVLFIDQKVSREHHSVSLWVRKAGGCDVYDL